MILMQNTCRLCESSDLELAFPMQPSPIGDAYVSKAELSIRQENYPLSLYMCMQCKHLQLPTVLDPKLLFEKYIYRTSASSGLIEHFKNAAHEIKKRVGSLEGKLVVEIGSNDGSMLSFFKSNTTRVLGIDPAIEIANEATKNGIETWPEFFSLSIAEKIKKKYSAATIIIANNVFAHANNMIDIIKGIRYLLADDGIFVFEVSYLVDIIQKNLFDTIYHEHLCYHHITPLEKCFLKHQLQFFDVQRITSKGGSIRGYVQFTMGKQSISSHIQELMQMENDLGINQIHVFKKCSQELDIIKNELKQILSEYKNKGKSIVGYGASPTVTTLLYQFELNDYLEFLVDDNPIKQGRFSPHHHIPVFSSDVLYEKKPDIILILAWQYANAIMARHKNYKYGQFIIPLPAIKFTDVITD